MWQTAQERAGDLALVALVGVNRTSRTGYSAFKMVFAAGYLACHTTRIRAVHKWNRPAQSRYVGM